MTIQEHMNSLIALRDDIPDMIDQIVKKRQNIITTMLKLRLYNYGTDGNYDLIGRYAPVTIKHKKEEGKKYEFVTLRDTGSFYAGMFILANKGEYSISSTDSATPQLIQKYGQSILELTPKQQIDVINNVINPDLQKMIDEKINDFEIYL